MADFVIIEDLMHSFDETNERSVFYNPRTAVAYSDQERVNGFQLEDGFNLYTDHGLVSYQNLNYNSFRRFEKAARLDKKSLSYKRFKSGMDTLCCSDWNKQDIHGKCYGGPYKQPEGSYACENAYNLCKQQAVRAMWKLPFSKRQLLETVRWGCAFRFESVRASNFICVWVQRKRAAMDRFVAEVRDAKRLRAARCKQELHNELRARFAACSL
jgi:hypothetical protein